MVTSVHQPDIPGPKYADFFGDRNKEKGTAVGPFNESQVQQALVKTRAHPETRNGRVEKILTSEISVSLKL
jgi:hypothetical protein